jgi:lipid II:glycine glycyltransferase (peptidoglycan interpeptide bridge formation enzyme)
MRVNGDRDGAAGLRVVRSLPRDRWSAFVERHPDASVFHTPEMYEVFADARHHRPAVWAAVDAGDDVRALLTPVSITIIGGPIRALTTRAVAYAGPLVGPDRADPEPLDALLRAYTRGAPRDAVFTEIRNVTDGGRLAPSLAAYGFRHEAHLNFLVDLDAGEDDIWARIAPAARRNIRKATRMGVTIEEATGPAAIETGYGVLREVYRRIRVPPPDLSLFRAAHRILGPLGRFQLLLARRGSEPIGVMTLLFHAGVVTYWYTGTLREQTALRVGDLLVWTAIEAGRSHGYRLLDLGGAGRPNEPYGVRDFKAKFGGTLVEHGRDIWTRAPLRMRVATTGYHMARRLVS